MATPIKPTPVLRGKDARRFEDEMRNTEKKTINKDEYQRILAAYRSVEIVDQYNKNEASNTSFFNGFWRGMASPAMLFDTLNLPKIQAIKQVTLPESTGLESLVNDWNAIGKDMKKAIASYGEKAHSR
jgi:hypothetical protein